MTLETREKPNTSIELAEVINKSPVFSDKEHTYLLHEDLLIVIRKPRFRSTSRHEGLNRTAGIHNRASIAIIASSDLRE